MKTIINTVFVLLIIVCSAIAEPELYRETHISNQELGIAFGIKSLLAQDGSGGLLLANLPGGKDIVKLDSDLNVVFEYAPMYWDNPDLEFGYRSSVDGLVVLNNRNILYWQVLSSLDEMNVTISTGFITLLNDNGQLIDSLRLSEQLTFIDAIQFGEDYFAVIHDNNEWNIQLVKFNFNGYFERIHIFDSAISVSILECVD